jgi:hypothetical protein
MEVPTIERVVEEGMVKGRRSGGLGGGGEGRGGARVGVGREGRGYLIFIFSNYD